MALALIGQYGSNNTVNTKMDVYWESISATQLRIALAYTLGAATNLGTGGDRYRNAEITVVCAGGTVTKTQEVKAVTTYWYASHRYPTSGYYYVYVDIPYQSGGTISVTVKTTGGTTTDSCLWTTTANSNYPSGVSLSWPVYNTKPYWPANSSITLNVANNFPENTTQIIVNWTAAADDQGNTLYYDLYRVSSLGTVLIAAGVTTRSFTDTIGAGNPGSTYRYDVYVHDGLLWADNGIGSVTVAKNSLTAARLACSGSFSWIGSGKQDLAVTFTAGANSNGNTTLTNTLSISGLTITNPTVSDNFNFSDHRSGAAPSNPYISWTALKDYFGSNFYGNLTLVVTTSNIYGTSVSSSITIAVDLRTNPVWATPGIAFSNGYTINSVVKYIPNVRAVTVSWNAATDDLGTQITYDIYYKKSTDAFYVLIKSVTTTSTTITPLGSVSAQLTYNLKIVARTAYNNQTESSVVNLLIDWYERPTFGLVSRVRNSTNVVVTLLMTQRTSIGGATITTLTFQKYNNGTPAAVNLPLTNWNPSFTYPSATYVDATFTIDTSYEMVCTFNDSISVAIGGTYATAQSLSISIPAYTPVLSVRKKGVGVNCINDGTGNYKLKLTGKSNSVADVLGNKGYFVDDQEVWYPGNDFAFNKHNWLINGGFNVWQRTTSRTLVSLAEYVADRWVGYMGDANGSLTISRQPFVIGQTTVPKDPFYFLRFAQTGNSAVEPALYQPIESVRTLAGQKCAVSIWARCSSGTVAVIPKLQQWFGSGGTPSDVVWTTGATWTLTTTWQRFTVVFDVPNVNGKTLGTNGNDSLCLYFSFPANSSYTLEFANATLVAGSVPVEYTPEPIAETLRKCWRYCQYRYMNSMVGSEANAYIVTKYATNDAAFIQIPLPVPMRVQPSHNFTGTTSCRLVMNGAVVTATFNNLYSANPYNLISISWNCAGYSGYGWADNFSANLILQAEL